MHRALWGLWLHFELREPSLSLASRRPLSASSGVCGRRHTVEIRGRRPPTRRASIIQAARSSALLNPPHQDHRRKERSRRSATVDATSPRGSIGLCTSLCAFVCACLQDDHPGNRVVTGTSQLVCIPALACNPVEGSRVNKVIILYPIDRC